MPADMSKYPKNWPEIRNKILLRAGGYKDDPRIGAKCEWCGVQNYAVGHRDNGKFYYIAGNIYLDECYYAISYNDAREVANNANENSDDEKYVVIVLTIAHINDPNPQNVDEKNLAALCQRCHNKYDIAMRRKNAKLTKIGRLISAGQMSLPLPRPQQVIAPDLLPGVINKQGAPA